jgi:tetratricopeptide (TPR) repeat protein
MAAQNGTGQFRLFVLPFKVVDIEKKDYAKFELELRRILEESGRYELVTSDELRDIKRVRGLNVRKPVPDTLAIPVAKDLGARIVLMGNLQLTQEGTIKTSAMFIEVLSNAEKDIGSAEISVGTDIIVLSEILANLIFRRADVDNHISWGKDYLRGHNFVRAIENFSKALELDSTIVEVHYYLGNAYLQNQDAENAMIHYETTIKMDSTYSEAAYRLGTIYLNKEAYDQAITLFTRLIKKEPDNFNYYLYAGIAYQNGEQLDEALAVYEQGHIINADEPRFCEYMGKIYYQQEQYQLAVDNFEEVDKIQSENIEILQYMSACYNQLNDFENAVAVYERIVAVDPAYPNGYKNLGIWYGKLKQYNKAIDALERGLRDSPENEHADIYLTLVDVYGKAGKHYKVIDVGNRALKYTSNNRIYVFLGDAYQAIGEALEGDNTSESFLKAIENYKASTANYTHVIKDAKYGKYAQQSIERNKGLIDRAELIIKKLRLDEG